MYTATLIAGFVALSSAATIQIAVGKDGLVFTPNSVTAAKGDIIEYQFFPPTHSVNMADFNNPCMPAASGGFGSGAFTTSNGMNASIHLTDLLSSRTNKVCTIQSNVFQ